MYILYLVILSTFAVITLTKLIPQCPKAMAPSQPSVRLLLLPLIKSRFLALLTLPLVVLILYKNQLSKQPSLKVKVKEAPQGGSWEALADMDDDWGIHEGSWGGGVKDWFGWRDKGRTSIIITGGAGQLGRSMSFQFLVLFTVCLSLDVCAY